MIFYLTGIELCQEHKVSAEDLAAIWVGYAHNKGINDITLDHLNLFSRDVLSKRKKKSVRKAEKYPVHDVTTLPMAYPFIVYLNPCI